MKKDASSRPGGPNRTKGASSGPTSKVKRNIAEVTRGAEKVKRCTDWNRLDRLDPAAIRAGIESDPDVHPTDERFWQGATIVMPRRKEVVTIRLDADLLEWFRQERGYQTRINAILRAYMDAKATG